MKTETIKKIKEYIENEEENNLWINMMFRVKICPNCESSNVKIRFGAKCRDCGYKISGFHRPFDTI